MTNPPPDRRSSRRQFLLIASLFFVPLAAAVWLYLSPDWRPGAGVQNGTLIDPPRPLPDISLTLPDGSAAPADALKRGWLLVHVSREVCDARCRNALDEMRQARLALDKDADRVRRILLHAGGCCESGFADEQPDLELLAAAGTEGAALLDLFPPAADGASGIYIVDPHGNLMMEYAATGVASGLLKDLERLLRLSHIG